jgi:hypothetical protein
MINYEQEVKKVYRDAECQYEKCRIAQEEMYHVTSLQYFIENEHLQIRRDKKYTIGKALLKKDAWQSAYEKLKKDGKI